MFTPKGVYINPWKREAKAAMKKGNRAAGMKAVSRPFRVAYSSCCCLFLVYVPRRGWCAWPNRESKRRRRGQWKSVGKPVGMRSADMDPSGGDADVDSRPAAGETMTFVEADVFDIDCSWTTCPGSDFKVRDVKYSQLKRKKNSEEALYDCIGMDNLRGKKGFIGGETLGKVVKLPPPREGIDDKDAIAKTGLPRLVIVNLQVPSKPSPMWNRGPRDPGVSNVLYFSIKPKTVKAANALGENKVCNNAMAPAINLWKRFVDEHRTNANIRRRFKGIGMVANFSELGLPSSLSSLNGKPVILFKTADIRHEGDVMQIDVAVHQFGPISMMILRNFLDKTPKLQIKGGFLIQGEADSELPECILCSIAVRNLHFDKAFSVRDPY